jgi:predicted N-acetyltransferase YhbS
VRFRIAEPADLEAVTALINLAFKVERFFVEGERIHIEAVRELSGKGRFILVYENDSLAGCVYVEIKGERGYVGLLSVNPKRQRSGIGSGLMQAAEEHCRESGCSFADLRIVNIRLELPGFYRRLGYRETGTAPLTAGIVTKIPCHFVEMTKALHRASEAAG